MLHYKVVPVPAKAVKVSKKEFYYGIIRGLSPEKAALAVEGVSVVVDEYTKRGWTLHSLEYLPMNVRRSKSIIEFLLGWIPILGNLICKNANEAREGREIFLYLVTFVREGSGN